MLVRSLKMGREDAAGNTRMIDGREPTLLLAGEVAALLRTSPKAIYSMIERGLLPGVVRVGRRVLIDRSDLLEWLRQKSTPSPGR